MNLDARTNNLNSFAEDIRNVRLILKGGIEGRDGYVVIGTLLGKNGEETAVKRHYHISKAWGAIPLKSTHITTFSLNKGSKGIIRIDSNYEGVFE